MLRMNYWTCQSCGKRTVGVHRLGDESSVTPFMLGCRATPGCKGTGYSAFYPGTLPLDLPAPHVEFFVPRGTVERVEFLRQQPSRDRPWWQDHLDNGGAAMRLMDGSPFHG